MNAGESSGLAFGLPKKDLEAMDRICNSQSHRAYYGLTTHSGCYRTPEAEYAAAVGQREGIWLREHGAGPGGLVK